MGRAHVTAVFAAFALAACTKEPAAARPSFTLSCDSADTSTQSTLFCVRTDTRNGDAVVLDLAKVPLTTGTSKASDGPSGTFETVCDSTNTAQKSDFRCLRLDTRTGDVVMLRLAELPRWPK
ncbi:MAG: hypothetical protein K8W52_24205 [Deltaproteobacteria bacterium]|nr:hypothetical protein [Deltaproteobacteria bacterium]